MPGGQEQAAALSRGGTAAGALLRLSRITFDTNNRTASERRGNLEKTNGEIVLRGAKRRRNRLM
jgi:hypothetical protein